MDGCAWNELRYLSAPADRSRRSLLSTNTALVKRVSCAAPDGMVVVYFSRLGGPMYTHERVTLSVVAEAIAQIKGAKFAGHYDNAKSYSGNVFFVPDDTLVLDEASCLGVRLPTDLFGAVVPYPFAKTKAITHQLLDPSADRPKGWSSAFAELVQDVVLPGYTVFSLDDARAAAARLLSTGPIRIKEPLAAGGAGHTVARTIDELETFLKAFPEAAIEAHGLAPPGCRAEAFAGRDDPPLNRSRAVKGPGVRTAAPSPHRPRPHCHGSAA
jgi:hypothetical protein